VTRRAFVEFKAEPIGASDYITFTLRNVVAHLLACCIMMPKH
jgi:hypothetical protein